MKRKAENATRRCRIVLFKQFEISLSVERKLLFPNGECRRGAFTTSARTKVAAYKLVINADLPRPLSNKCSTGHYSGSSRFLWIWKQFAPTTNPPLYPLLFLSADTPDINPRTTINDPDQLEYKRSKSANCGWERGTTSISFWPKLFSSPSRFRFWRGTLVNLTRGSSDLKSFIPLCEF